MFCNSLEQFNQLSTANYCRIYWQSMLNLLGFEENPSIFCGEALKEVEFLSRQREVYDSVGLYLFHSYKLMLCYLFGDIETARKNADEARNYLIAVPNYIFAVHMFYLFVTVQK